MTNSKLTLEFRASSRWDEVNAEFIGLPTEADLDSFKSGRINSRLASWNVESSAYRYHKTIIFNEMMALAEHHLAWLDKMDGRSIGRPITVRVRNRDVCMDYMLSLHELIFIEDVLSDIRSVTEVGAGYGRTCHAVLSVFENIETYRIVDLAPSLELSRLYLSKVLPGHLFDKISFVANCSLAGDNPTRTDLYLAINTMAELDADIARNYLALINESGRYFYCKSPLGKYSPSSVGIKEVKAPAVADALAAGLLTDILDIFDSQALEAIEPKFLSVYSPGPAWTIRGHSRARPWTYFHQVIYERQ